MVTLKEVFYVANIIDYARVVLLVLAAQCSGYQFAAYYSLSYLLDAIDGPVARALGQESKLGYYLDMVIDRISSCMCLHFAAVSVLAGSSCVPDVLVPFVVAVLYGCLVLVEVAAHSLVMVLSEFLGVHQKQMGFDYQVVRLYLGDKRILFWACVSFEMLGIGLVADVKILVLLGLPGFLFRAVANVCRMISTISSQAQAGSSAKFESRSD